MTTHNQQENDAKAPDLHSTLSHLYHHMDAWAAKADNAEQSTKIILQQRKIAVNAFRKQLVQSVNKLKTSNLSSCINIETCPAMEYIIMILNNYQNDNLEEDVPTLLMEIETKNQPFLLNLYHHILNDHLSKQYNNNDENINNDQFAAVYKKIISIIKDHCHLSICDKYIRHRDRKIIQSKININMEYYINLLDMIHCNLIHSYDTGLRMQKHNSNNNNNNIQTVKADSATNTQSKYFTEMKSTKNDNKTASFDFGHKYYYWDSFRDNEYYDYGPNAGSKKCDWHIEQKYDNLKEELIENEIYPLCKRRFERALQKANQYLLSEMAKRLRSDSSELCEHCQIQPGTPIQQDNLLVLIIYSDYTTLCTQFSSTFRKHSDETLDEMKDRNSEIWNWSKLLIETVELYGKSICDSKIDTFYHGVSYMTFPTFLSYFCGPTSTTPIIEVAQNFCGTSGLVLELKKENDFSLLKHFNLSWISAYTNEDERLFIWGNKPLKFHSIRYAKLNENYQIYIFALTFFDYILNGKKLTVTDKALKLYNNKHAKVINVLMKHHDPTSEYKNKFPQYVNETFKTFIENKKQITIHLNAVNEDYSFIRQYITTIFQSKKNKNNLLLFHSIAKIFKNCELITVWNDAKEENGNILTLQYLNEFAEILHNLNLQKYYSKIKLKTIKLNDVRYYDSYTGKLKFLDQHTFTDKYGAQFPANVTLKVINQTRKRNGTRSIIRSDLEIYRSMKMFKKMQELSHAQSAMRKQTSNSNSSFSRFSQTSSVYNPSMTVASIYHIPSKITKQSSMTPTSQNISVSNVSFSDYSHIKQINSKPSKAVGKTLGHINENSVDKLKESQIIMNEQFGKPIYNINIAQGVTKDQKTKPISMKKRISHIIITRKPSTTSEWDNDTRNISKNSFPENNKITFDNLYSNLIVCFRDITQAKYRKPTQIQLKPFFKIFCQSNDALLIHVNQFEMFYLWFKSMCNIILDFRHMYDNPKIDVLNTLFYARNKAVNILTKTHIQRGTFLLRISEQRNKLYISCKGKENKATKIHHYFFTRIANEVYRIGDTNSSQEIFKIIRSSKQLKYLYDEKCVIKKSTYF